MGIRIQPKDIPIPEDDPFQNDLLSRKDTAEILTNLVGSIEGPCVLAVDAEWGNGKSTFLRLWSQHLRNDDFPIVELNAWETDYAENPFVTLSTELTDGLQEHSKSSVQKMIHTVQASAADIALVSVPHILRLVSGGILTGESQLENEIRKSISEVTGNCLSAYRKARNSVQDFKENLQTMTNKVSEEHGDKPVLVMIDELDRCRPSYAIEFLEVAKHLFSVDRIIFVLAINRSELSHSVKSLYGQDFDANGYLKRFIDIDFVLPSPNRKQFINDLLIKINLSQYFEKTNDQGAINDGFSSVEILLGNCLGKSTVSLRQISQAIHRIGLVLASLSEHNSGFIPATVTALIIRTIDEDLYHRFCMENATDIEVIDSIFPGEENGVMLNELHRYLFEGTVILGYQEISGKDSPLLRKYRALFEDPDFGNGPVTEYLKNAEAVIDYVRIQLTHAPLDPIICRRTIGFKHAIHRIELFSNELKGEDDS